jgi:hypothetical protein
VVPKSIPIDFPIASLSHKNAHKTQKMISDYAAPNNLPLLSIFLVFFSYVLFVPFCG